MIKRNLVLVLIVVLYNSILLAQTLPDIPDLIRVTVDHSDNGVLIQWEPSADTDVEFYNLYKMNQDLSFFRLFSFNASTLEYKHMTSGLKNLAYTVTAKDSSGNESLFGQNVHRAVQVLAEFDPIASANKVIWTAYEGWEGDISGYRLHGGLTGDTPDELTFVPHTTKQWYHTSIIADTTYKYYIETVNINGITSLSPIDSVSTYQEGVRIENRNISEFQIYPFFMLYQS